MSEIIQIKELSKKYPNGVNALNGITLKIDAGCFFALLGPNGAGKSTLVKIVTTLIPKDSGSFSINGLNPENNLSKIQRIIGVASQENELDPVETVENHLLFQCRLFGMTDREAVERSSELIEKFEIETERHKRAGILSGGNKRRLHCALALVHHPGILFLDEPTVGMDPMARSTFWKVITELNQTEKTTVFLTTQYLEEADKHVSEMGLIFNGRVHYCGAISAFKEMVIPTKDSTLDESYLLYMKSLNSHSTDSTKEVNQ